MMPSFAQFAFFSVAALLLLIIPGPSVLYVTASAIAHGKRGSLLSVIGLAAGDAMQVLMAALGLAAILAASESAFAVIKYAGAAYLFWLAYGRWRAAGATPGASSIAMGISPWRALGQAFMVNALNPKSTLFFLAFLPTFVDQSKGAITMQILLLGSVFIVLGACTNTAWAFLAGFVGQKMRGHRFFHTGQHYFSAGIYFILGCIALLTGHRRA